MAATFAAMVLLYALFAKFVPIISIWELKAGELPAPQGHATPGPLGGQGLRRRPAHERHLRPV